MLTHLRKNHRTHSLLLSLFTLSFWLPVITQTQHPNPTIYSKLSYHHLPALNPDAEQPNASPITRTINEHNRRSMLYEIFDRLERKRKNFHEKTPILSDFSWDDLELFLGEQDRTKHLFGRINRTRTSMGDVQLQRWLVQPTDDHQVIKDRQELITYLAENNDVRERLDALLEGIARNENSLLSFWDKNDTRQLALRNVVEPEVDENVQKLLDADRTIFEKVAAPIMKLVKGKPKVNVGRKFDTNALKLHTQAALGCIWNFKGAMTLPLLLLPFYYVKSHITKSNKVIREALRTQHTDLVAEVPSIAEDLPHIPKGYEMANVSKTFSKENGFAQRVDGMLYNLSHVDQTYRPRLEKDLAEARSDLKAAEDRVAQAKTKKNNGDTSDDVQKEIDDADEAQFKAQNSERQLQRDLDRIEDEKKLYALFAKTGWSKDDSVRNPASQKKLKAFFIKQKEQQLKEDEDKLDKARNLSSDEKDAILKRMKDAREHIQALKKMNTLGYIERMMASAEENFANNAREAALNQGLDYTITIGKKKKALSYIRKDDDIVFTSEHGPFLQNYKLDKQLEKDTFFKGVSRHAMHDASHPLEFLKGVARYPGKLYHNFQKAESKTLFFVANGATNGILVLWFYLLYSSFKSLNDRKKQTYLVQDLVRSCGMLLDDTEVLFDVCKEHAVLADALPGLSKVMKSLNPKKSKNKHLIKMRSLLNSSSVRANYFGRYFSSAIGKIYAGYNQLRNEKEHLASTLQLIGNIDALVSMAKYYKEMQQHKNSFCLVELDTAAKPHVHLDGFWNPMIDPDVVVPSTIHLGGNNTAKNAIISGPNAGGKSVSMKAITLCILLGQTFGIAPASRMVFTPFSSINTYLNIKDDIAMGRSKFRMEALRANNLIERIEGMEPTEELPHGRLVFSMMDETFSSTDPKEGAAAAYSILRYLTENTHNSMTVSATHFPLLKRLQAHTNGSIKNFMIRAETNPISYPFELYEGSSDQVIAIDLLQEEGLDVQRELRYARDILNNPASYE